MVPWPFAIHRGVFAWNRMTLDPSLTEQAVIKLAMLVGYFFVASQVVRTNLRLSLVVNVLIGLGFVVAVVGILNNLTFNGRILWFRESEYALGAFGPFVSRNHFAGFLELLIPLPLAMIFGRGAHRDKWVLYGFMAVTMSTALVLSASRGGMMTLLVQLLILPVLAQRERQQRRRLREWESEGIGALTSGASEGNRVPSSTRSSSARAQRREDLIRNVIGIVVISATIVVGVIWIGAEPVVSRLSSPSEGSDPRLSHDQSRPATWKNTLKLIADHPIVGVGLGAYPKVYPYYDDSTGFFFVGEAHNDYLQLLADTGLVGGLLGVFFLVSFVRLSRRALSALIPLERSVALGCTLGCLGMFVHSLVDFNLQITANALVFLVLVALLEQPAS
jgi:O-antigen ligase